MLGYRTKKITVNLPVAHADRILQMCKKNNSRLADEVRAIVEEKLLELYPGLDKYGRPRNRHRIK